MTDVVGKRKRSEIMRAVRSSGNKSTELETIRILKKYGLKGWRRQSRVFGKPDFVWENNNVALFIDGCFWHGCKKCYRRPKSNKPFWDKKVKYNQKRDRTVNRFLSAGGWKVVRISECELKNETLSCVNKISKAVFGRSFKQAIF